MCTGVHVKYPLFLSYFNETWTSSTDFRKIIKYQILWKSVQWDPSSMRTDGQTDRYTDMTTLVVAFRNFASAPKSGVIAARSSCSVWCKGRGGPAPAAERGLFAVIMLKKNCIWPSSCCFTFYKLTAFTNVAYFSKLLSCKVPKN